MASQHTRFKNVLIIFALVISYASLSAAVDQKLGAEALVPLMRMYTQSEDYAENLKSAEDAKIFLCQISSTEKIVWSAFLEEDIRVPDGPQSFLLAYQQPKSNFREEGHTTILSVSFPGLEKWIMFGLYTANLHDDEFYELWDAKHDEYAGKSFFSSQNMQVKTEFSEYHAKINMLRQKDMPLLSPSITIEHNRVTNEAFFQETDNVKLPEELTDIKAFQKTTGSGKCTLTK